MILKVCALGDILNILLNVFSGSLFPLLSLHLLTTNHLIYPLTYSGGSGRLAADAASL
jgi:hypothetical protein